MMPTKYVYVSVVILLVSGNLTSCNDGVSIPQEPCGSDWSEVQYPERSFDRVNIPQGVWGDVWFYEGNFMPMCPTGTVNGVGRELQVYELTTLDDVVFDTTRPIFISEIHTELVATVWSDAKGFFQLPFPVGDYSIFSLEDTLFYPRGFGSGATVSPFTVHADSATGFVFDIRYASSS